MEGTDVMPRPRSARILSHGAIYVVGTVIQNGLSLLLLPIVLHVMTLEEYGLVGTCVALAALLALVYNLGINMAIVRSYYDDDRNEPTAGWSALLGAQLLLAGAMAGLTYVTGPVWSDLFRNVGWQSAVQVAVLFAYVNAVLMSAQGIVRAARRPILFVVASVLQLLVGSGLGIWLAIDHGATGYLVGLTIGAVCSTLLCLAATYRPPRWRLGIVTAGLRLGFPFMFHALSNWGINLADRLLVAFYLGVAAVGRYQVAYVLASAGVLVLTSVQAAWAPHYIGELDEESRRRLPPLLVVPVTVLVTLATGLLVLAAPFIVELIAPQVHDTELIIALVAAAALARAPYFVAVVVLLDARKTATLASSSVMAAGLNIALNIALIPTVGLPAAAAATAAAAALQALVVLLRVQGILSASMRLTQLGLVWAVGLAGLVAIAELPDTPAADLVRALVALACVAGGWRCARWIRRTYLAVTGAGRAQRAIAAW